MYIFLLFITIDSILEYLNNEMQQQDYCYDAVIVFIILQTQQYFIL